MNERPAKLSCEFVAARTSAARSPAPRLRVLHCVPGAWLPVTQSWLYDQARFLPQDVQSHIACDRVENAADFGAPSLHSRDAMAWWRRGVDAALRAARLSRSGLHRSIIARQCAAGGEPLEVLHSHFGPEGWRNLALAKRRGMKHVVTFYGYDVNCLPRVNPRWRDRYRELFAEADLILCEGEHMASCIATLGCEERKIRVHRLGIDLDAVEFAPRSWTAGEPLRALMAASFREKKGLSLGIEALGRLRDELDLRITIIGDATAAAGSAEERERILDAIERHKLGDRVRMLGFQPHEALRREAKEHHLFLAPSLTATDGDTEGGAPVAVIEMAAAGMIVVSTNHCDIPGVVQHDRTGFLARDGDADDLAMQIRRAVRASHRWPQMQRDARRWIARQFDARVQGERLAAIYAEVCAGWRYHDNAPSTDAAPSDGGSDGHAAMPLASVPESALHKKAS